VATASDAGLNDAWSIGIRLARAERLRRQIRFLVEAEALKRVLRRTPLLDGSRVENDAEHSWELALMALVLEDYAKPSVDIGHVLKLVTVHDLVEIDAGDVFLYDDAARAVKCEREAIAAKRIFALLPADQAAEVRGLWEEFERESTPEAVFAKALDSLQPFLHNYFTNGGTWRANGVTDAVVRAKKQVIAKASPELWEFVEALLDSAVERGILACDRSPAA
jgi:putative hydrolases of HD superfamily